MAGPVYVTWLDGLRLDKRVFRVTTSTTLFTLAIVRSVAYLAGGVFAVLSQELIARLSAMDIVSPSGCWPRR